jgi:hypothetical protein
MIALNNGTFIWEIMNEYWYQLSGKIFLQWAHGPSLQITMGQELASNLNERNKGNNKITELRN